MSILTRVLRNSILMVLLLDADVIIWCAKKGKLNALFKRRKIQIPKVIFEQVIHYTIPETGQKKTILADKYIEDGSLRIIDNPVSKEIIDIKNTYKKCPELAKIHNGEAECISLLLEKKEFKFCTGDTDTMKVISFLDLAEQAISLEQLIGKVRDIRENFTEDCMKFHLGKGSALRVQYTILK